MPLLTDCLGNPLSYGDRVVYATKKGRLAFGTVKPIGLPGYENLYVRVIPEGRWGETEKIIKPPTQVLVVEAGEGEYLGG